MAGYACIWEYRVRPGDVAEFERHYRPGGSWARLFRRSEAYVQTLLLRDPDEPLCYLTIDRWSHAEGYRSFRSQFEAEYAHLDAACEALTTKERLLGELTEIADGVE